jgi:small subunit ribosomal protein S3
LGHKVHPNGFRLGVFRPWEANWFANPKDYTKMLHEDLEMRRVILARLRNAGIAKIETERSSNAQLTVTIHTAKPGIVIGKGGASVDQLREDLEKRFGNRVRISIQEIKQPELDAQLVAENIASQIERRISYKRAMKQAILRTMRSGAKGVRIYCGGRLRGAEMARREWDREGRVPLHTLRANIDFGRATASTTFGAIGVKCWIYKEAAPPRKLAAVAEASVPIAEIIAPQPLLEAVTEPQVEVQVPGIEQTVEAKAPKRARAAAAPVAAASVVVEPQAEAKKAATRVTAASGGNRAKSDTTRPGASAGPKAAPKAKVEAKAAAKTEASGGSRAKAEVGTKSSAGVKGAPKAKAETKAPVKKTNTKAKS